jgi:hypothetical protein
MNRRFGGLVHAVQRRASVIGRIQIINDLPST